MFQTQTMLVSSVFVLLFMHQLVMLESAPTSTNIITSSMNRTKRAVSIIPESYLWKDAIIQFEMESNLEPQRCLIESAMMHIMLQSCVLFRPIQHQNRHEQKLVILKDDNNRCAATLGAGWMSRLYLDSNQCFNIGVILHELMHVLGFEHEHQRSDRDQYLRINYDNIRNSDKLPQFDKNHRLLEKYFPQFDIDSITMYGPVDESTRLKIIESKVFGKQVVSSKDKLNLSPLDVKSINELYKCHLVDNKPCEKLVLLHWYITDCSAEARKYINLSLIKQLIDQCNSCRVKESGD